ncbi:hypothetical protein BC936DRAFT_138876 [Jimgerdemannia flammicorona]|uniref:Uncharacterized protein n=1 Tax=Jimgerdemannia flammicorona TaxID=994334 RepID=A0A433DI53_9FUNG|nr:hypothetical protein BC936DRAFT_138876 [Jimgerdemannia flammicorona]
MSMNKAPNSYQTTTSTPPRASIFRSIHIILPLIQIPHPIPAPPIRALVLPIPLLLIRAPVPLIRVPASLIRVPAPFIRVPAPFIRVPAPFIRVPAPLIRVPAPLIRVPAPRIRDPVLPIRISIPPIRISVSPIRVPVPPISVPPIRTSVPPISVPPIRTSVPPVPRTSIPPIPVPPIPVSPIPAPPISTPVPAPAPPRLTIPTIIIPLLPLFAASPGPLSRLHSPGLLIRDPEPRGSAVPDTCLLQPVIVPPNRCGGGGLDPPAHPVQLLGAVGTEVVPTAERVGDGVPEVARDEGSNSVFAGPGSGARIRHGDVKNGQESVPRVDYVWDARIAHGRVEDACTEVVDVVDDAEETFRECRERIPVPILGWRVLPDEFKKRDLEHDELHGGDGGDEGIAEAGQAWGGVCGL